MQTKQRLDVPLSLKSVSDSGEFEGYGSVFGVKDSHDDVVMSGAFAASLRAWSDRKALPALLWQHRMDEPIGVYTEMKEDDVGLYVRGRLLIDDDPLAKRAHAHMKAGSLTGLSIGYVLKDWEYDRSKEAFLLKEIDLWEVSLVTFPSNDEARITTLQPRIKNGSKVEVLIGDELVITGWVEATPVRYDARSVSTGIAGRSLTADLIDCAAEPTQFNGRSLVQIAQALAAPFGIEVVNNGAPSGVIPDVQPDHGETVIEVINKILGQQQALAYDDPHGRLVIGGRDIYFYPYLSLHIPTK